MAIEIGIDIGSSKTVIFSSSKVILELPSIVTVDSESFEPYFFGEKAKQTLGLIRGKFSGKVNIPQAEMSMDYQMLIQQGKEEYDKAIEALDRRLERMRPANMMEEQSKLVENQNKIQQYSPLGIYVI